MGGRFSKERGDDESKQGLLTAGAERSEARPRTRLVTLKNLPTYEPDGANSVSGSNDSVSLNATGFTSVGQVSFGSNDAEVNHTDADQYKGVLAAISTGSSIGDAMKALNPVQVAAQPMAASQANNAVAAALLQHGDDNANQEWVKGKINQLAGIINAHPINVFMHYVNQPEKLRELCYLLLLKSVLGLNTQTLSVAQKSNLRLMLKTIEGSQNFTDAVKVLNQTYGDTNTLPELSDLLATKKDWLESRPKRARSLVPAAFLVAGMTGLANSTSIMTPFCFAMMCSSGCYGVRNLRQLREKEAKMLALSLVGELQSVNQPVHQPVHQSVDDSMRQGQGTGAGLSDHQLRYDSEGGTRSEDGSVADGVAQTSETARIGGGAAAMSAGSPSGLKGKGHAGALKEENEKADQSMADLNLKAVGKHVDDICATLKNGEPAISLSLNEFFERHSDLQRFTALFQAEGLPHGSRNEFINMVCSCEDMRRKFIAIPTSVAVSGHTEVFTLTHRQGGGSSVDGSLGLAGGTSRDGERSFAGGDGNGIGQDDFLSDGNRSSDDSSPLSASI